MQIKSHNTAIGRNKLSAPMKTLFCHGAISKDKKILDFGCGRGSDVTLLQEKGFKIEGYDLHFKPSLPQGSFDLVTCIYVLNTIPDKNDRMNVIKNAWRKVSPGGQLFLAVREKSSVDKDAEKGQWDSLTDGFISSLSRQTFQKGFTELSLSNLIESCYLPNVNVVFTDPQPMLIKNCVTALIEKNVDSVE